VPPRSEQQNTPPLQHEQPEPTEICVPGLGRGSSKLILSSRVDFEGAGNISGFHLMNAESTLKRRRAWDLLATYKKSHPGSSDAEYAAVLKQAGVKYGPSDQAELVKRLPVRQLERFLGKLEIVSADFWINELNWEVKVKATRRNGSRVLYNMYFECFNGGLESIEGILNLTSQ
jgi:hypothetical protein